MKKTRDVARKSGFEGSEIRISELAKSLGMPSRPITLKELSNRPAVILYDTGVIRASAVSGNVQLAIASDGRWTFQGSLSSDATLIGDFFEMEMTLNFVDSNGFQRKQMKTGELGSDIFGPSSSISWQDHGHDEFIRINWNSIRAQAYTGKLSVKDSGGQILAFIGTGFIFAALAATAILLASGNAELKPLELRRDKDGNLEIVQPIGIPLPP